MLKRSFDLGVSSVGLVFLSPLFLLLALLIKLEDAGPVFYRGVRVGRHGALFRIFKFRSMVADAESLGGPSTADDDPRLTAVGKIIRKYKLDELPQLLNVWKGDMSIVGPRPEVKRYTDLYSPEEQTILSLRPGITDYASVWNSDEGAVLAGAADVERAYLDLIRPTKIKLQLQYVREASLMTDVKIIALTLKELVRPRRMAVEVLKSQA